MPRRAGRAARAFVRETAACRGAFVWETAPHAGFAWAAMERRPGADVLDDFVSKER